MKRITALLLIVLSLVVMLTSCGGNLRPTTKGREENAIYAAMSGSVPNTLDPDHFALQNEDGIINEVYETLIRQGLDGTIVNFLAEEITPNEDGSVSVKLRDAKFHSGDTLKTEDILYTFERIQSSALNSKLYGIIEFEVEDDTHFTMKFPEGVTYDDLVSYLVNVRIVNKSWMEERVDDISSGCGLEEDGTGAYYFAGISDGGDVTLKRFEDYWGNASIDTVYFKYLSGDANIAFEAGDIDYCGYTAALVSNAESYENVSITEIATTSTTFLIIGCNDALVTSDIKVRQAIAYALERADIADAASDGSGKVNYNIAPPTVEYYTEDVEKFERDVEKSKQLLTEAGYSETNRVPIELITLGAQTQWVSACELVKANLEESYFDVEISQQSDTSRYFMGDFNMGIINFSYTTSFAMYNILFDMTSGLDLAGYTDPAILETFAAIKDEASAQKAMREAVDTLAYYPLFSPVSYYAFDSNLDLGENYENGTNFMKDAFWK